MKFSPASCAAVAAVASWSSACALPLYEGARRPSEEVAVVGSRGVIIQAVDGTNVEGRLGGWKAGVEVLPGLHELALKLDDGSSRQATACIQVRPGHHYRAQPRIFGTRWEPRVVDADTGNFIDPYCRGERDAEIGRLIMPRAPARPAPFRPRPTEPSTTEPPSIAPSTTEPPSIAPPSLAAAGSTVAPGPPAVVPTPTPAAPVTPAIDREDPTAAKKPFYAPRQQVEASEERRLPGSGFSAMFGGAVGGEDFVKTSGGGGDQTLSSGQGFLFGVGAMVTPWWFGEVVGLGGGVDFALKQGRLDATNGEATITRFPLSLTAHLLTNFNGRSRNYLLVRGGLSHELGVHYHAAIDGQGSVDADADGTWGGTFSAGYYRSLTRLIALDASFFVTTGEHVINGHHFDANCAGITTAIHFNL